MANNLTLWTPSPNLGLAQRAQISRDVLSHATSPRDAIDAAERLVGQWPHARPPDPKTYAASLAAVLAQYPLGLVQECCDPRKGLARTREFPPTVAALVEWCEKRLEWHSTVARYVPPKRIERVEPVLSETERATMRERVGALFAGLLASLKERQRAQYEADTKRIFGRPIPPAQQQQAVAE